jgi:DNA-binding GntR family transcriptional regulator
MQRTPTHALAGADADEPLDVGGSSERAYEQLRGKILRGELAPGAAFSQVQLAIELGISRTPLREAVRRLQSEGLLRSEHNRRVRVSPLTTQDFEDLYAMRIALESLAVRIGVPRLSDADLDQVRQAFELSVVAAEKGDLEAYHEPHRRFHLGLFSRAGTRLVERVEDLWDHAERYRRFYHGHAGEQTQIAQLASRDHEGIFTAAAERDGRLCAQRVAAHLGRTALMTMVRVDHRHDPDGIRAALDLVCAEEPALTDDLGPVDEDVRLPGYLRDTEAEAGSR